MTGPAVFTTTKNVRTKFECYFPKSTDLALEEGDELDSEGKGSERSENGSGGAGPLKTRYAEDLTFKLGPAAIGVEISLHCQIDNPDRQDVFPVRYYTSQQHSHYQLHGPTTSASVTGTGGCGAGPRRAESQAVRRLSTPDVDVRPLDVFCMRRGGGRVGRSVGRLVRRRMWGHTGSRQA